MILSEITQYIESRIPLALQDSYDNCGLLVGDPDLEISSALICVDVTEDVISEAVAKKANLIISHHPLIFSGLKKLTGTNHTERLVIKAIKLGIAIYALHTNLDNHAEGVNALLCKKMGINNPEILKNAPAQLCKLVTFSPLEYAPNVRQALLLAGAGHIGNYAFCSFSVKGEGTFKALNNAKPFVGEIGKMHKEQEERIETVFYQHQQNAIIEALLKSHPYEEVAYDLYPLHNKSSTIGAGMIGELDKEISCKEYLLNIKKTLGIGCLKHTHIKNKKVKKIAVCGGSGSFLIKEAMQAKADVFLTGDLKYHDYFLPEKRMVLADIGHYESEQFTKELIHTLLNEKFTTFALQISEINTNPIHYL